MGDCRVIIWGLSGELIFSSFDNGWWFVEYEVCEIYVFGF